jgi:hypothetical protein
MRTSRDRDPVTLLVLAGIAASLQTQSHPRGADGDADAVESQGHVVHTHHAPFLASAAHAKRVRKTTNTPLRGGGKDRKGGSDLSTVPPTYPADVDPVGYGYCVASTPALAGECSMTTANPMRRPWAMSPERWHWPLCRKLVIGWSTLS